MAELEYQAKPEGTSWDKSIFPWATLTDDHQFSLFLDYRFRIAVEFIPGYYRDNSGGKVLWWNLKPNLRYWTRVKVLDAENNEEYTAAE